MKDDFDEAAQRHWEDAEILRDHRRWPNADQLYGLSAECALKAAMQVLGTSQTARRSEWPPKLHINQLWGQFHTLAGGPASRYAAALPVANPFQNWHVDQRYWNSSEVREDSIDGHREGAEEARRLLGRLRIDGRLP